MAWSNGAAFQRVDVVIAGGGPVGLTVANLLGTYGLRTLLFERETAVAQYARATNVDDEALRTFQLIGLVERQMAGTLPDPYIQVNSGLGRRVAELRSAGHEQLGFPRISTILQPDMETVLQEGVGRFGCVQMHRGYSVEGFSQEADHVTVQIREADGTIHEVEAGFLLGCDGGRSTVRKLCNISLQARTPPETWVLIEAQGEEGPGCFRFFGALDHPMVFVQQPRGYQRWSIRLRSKEEAEAIEQLDRAGLEALISPWKDGPRLGQVLRKRLYQTRTLVAERFRQGRVFLVGDSAHMMPPYAGQGLCSGLRDAVNLCWKLALVLRGKAHPRLLDSYETERQQHVEEAIAATLRLGWLFFPRGRGHDLVRRSLLRLLLGVPVLRQRFIRRTRALPRLKRGLLLGGPAAGSMFLQPQVRRVSGEIVRLDTLLGEGFAAVGLGVDPLEAMGSEARLFWSRLGARAVSVVPAGQEPKAGSPRSCEQVVDESGMLARWFAAGRGEIALVRPDRYVAALLPASRIETAMSALRGLLESPEPSPAAPAPHPLQSTAQVKP